MKNKEIVSWQDQKASERFAMISPLLADDLDPAKRSQLRSRIAETSSVSERTLYRLEAAWRREGFSGLRPVNRRMRRSPMRFLPWVTSESIEILTLKRYTKTDISAIPQEQRRMLWKSG